MIIKLKGGLGNQMFQYAFGRALSLKKRYELILDTSGYDVATHDTPRHYSLDVFNIEAVAKKIPRSAVEIFLGRIVNKIFPEKLYAYNQSYITGATKNSYLEGWWQNESYFLNIQETIRKDFTLKKTLSVQAKEIKDQIEQSILPVSLHIRRGDYVSNPAYTAHHGVSGLKYYSQALQTIFEKTKVIAHIFVFSDDIEWCKEHLAGVIPSNTAVTYVSRPEIADYEELVLMAACKHHIIANSSFSWWGAWLNPSEDKIVIAPKQWVADPAIDTSKATPSSWIRL